MNPLNSRYAAASTAEPPRQAAPAPRANPAAGLRALPAKPLLQARAAVIQLAARLGSTPGIGRTSPAPCPATLRIPMHGHCRLGDARPVSETSSQGSPMRKKRPRAPDDRSARASNRTEPTQRSKHPVTAPNRALARAKRPTLLLAGIAASAAVLLAAASASAHTASFGAQHSLSLAGTGLLGQVSSAAEDCAGGRSVTLYRVAAAGDTAVATMTTDASGAWSRHAGGLQGGEYYAVAAQRMLKSPGHRHTCEAARSNTVSVPPDSDGDGVRDPSDNCPDVANPGQQDSDGDGLGDACNPDADLDGYTVADGDCADNDPYRHPGAADNRPDGIDDDCDGSIDEDVAATGIVYSDMYWRLMAEFPAGWADSCELHVFLSGSGGFCDALIDDPQWFYPDGTWGPRPWVIDPSSPNGWSIEPGLCDSLTDADYQEWLAYLEADPSMSDPELQAGLTHPFDLYVACYVPFEGF
jgi:Putative metal-binding motif